MRHAQNAIGALGTLSRNPVATALTVTVIGIALALPAALGVLVQSGRSLAGGWADVRDFSVYLAPGVGLDRAEALARELRNKAGIEAVRLIAADAAVAELSKDPGFAGALAALDSNPLPHTLVVRPRAATDRAALEQLAAEVQKAPDVDLVKVDLQWVERLNAALDFLRRLGLITGGLLIATVVIVVGNTIRLDIQNRSAEIEVAKLLGATDAFVRRPFLYLGLWYGILGGLVAMLILLIGLWALGGPISQLAGLYGSSFELGGASGGSLLAVLAGGVLAGWGGAWTAVSRHLAAIQPQVG
ncbi:MAG: permease-like cell division protein FtsX [Gammaproteobacteria bacterium]|nr:permease-like cell division protein FtsX [Gammaproteobacteria bacterium]